MSWILSGKPGPRVRGRVYVNLADVSVAYTPWRHPSRALLTVADCNIITYGTAPAPASAVPRLS